jgi:hypothetical protein
MSALMWAARRLVMLGEPPPHKIVRRLLARAGARPRGAHRRFLSWLSHFAFGAAAGAVFAPAAATLRTGRRRAVAGALYGAAMWTGLYGYALPALGLMPRPSRDRPGRPAAMALAHLAYGAALGAMVSGSLQAPSTALEAQR